MLDVHTHHLGDTDVVLPAGDLDLATAPSVAAALTATVAPRVILDLRRVTFIDSSGIGMIIKFQRHFAVEGIRFGVVKGGDQVQRAFAIAHVEPLLPWADAPQGETYN